MTRRYARGDRAWGHCERCGDRYLLKKLQYDGQFPDLLVCSSCWDPKHPQEYLPSVTDPVSLYDPTGDEGRSSNKQVIVLPAEAGGLFEASQETVVRPQFPLEIRVNVNKVKFNLISGPGGGSGGVEELPAPDSFIMALTEDSSTESPRIFISDGDITSWPETGMTGSGSGQIGARNGLVWDGSKWVSVGAPVGASINQIWSSDNDGAGDWDEITVFNELLFTFQDVGYSATHNFIACQSSGGIYGSSNGADGNWFSQTGIGVTEDLYAVDASEDDAYYVVGDAGVVIRGLSGANVEKSAPAATNLRAVKQAGSRVCVAGANGIVYRSDDEGDSWSAMTGTALSGGIRALAHNGDGTWIAVGINNDLLRSTDNAATFSTISTGFGADVELYAAIYDTGVEAGYGFVVGGDNGSNRAFIATSEDGETWTERVTTADISFSRVLSIRGKNTL